MKLDEIVAWYQKKIGTYDKQQWEKTVEQKILDGFSSVTLKTAKLKTEFIDVDLVRGSTFPKAKPKQTLLTVIRLAVLRYLFLPVYATWWVKQTSPNVFVILLLIYITQMINWAVYTYNVHRLESYSTNSTSNAGGKLENVTSSTLATNHVVEPHIISLPDLLIPMALSLLLSLIHSQIVATNTASGAKVNHRRFSNGSQNGKQPSREPSRVRRRKKLVKIRSQDGSDGIVFSILQQQQQQKRKPLATQLLHSGVEVLTKSQINTSEGGCTNAPIEAFNSTSAMHRSPFRTASAILKLELNNAVGESDCNDKYTENVALHKKRNVKWHSSLHDFVAETQEKQQQTSPQQLSSTTTTTATNSSQDSTPSNAADSDAARGSTRDAMATGNSSSSSGSRSPNKSMRIDESVQEFYDDLIDITDRNLARAAKRVVGEDDGFESLNGKSSSGEEITHTALSTTTVAVPGQQHLRLRLNAADLRSRSVDDDDVCRRKLVPLSPESDYEKKCKKMQSRAIQISSDETEEEGDDGEVGSSPASVGNNLNYNECTTSATEWLGVTTNSEECSYSSELEHSDEYKNNHMSDEDGYDLDFTPTTILNSHGATDRISCTIWAQREIKKAQMSVLEISSCIIDRVESMPETNDYIYIGIGFSLLLSLIPTFCRLCEVTLDADKSNEINYLEMPMLLWEKASFSLLTIFGFAFGHTHWERIVLVIGIMQRLCLTTILFIIFAVAERTFKQRFLYAKLFSHLTSSRRARKSNLPHFRLNKVRNIKTWLSVRSYLKKRGPQRSVDVIVSAAFMVTLLLLAFLSVEWLKDSVHMHSHLNLEALLWSTAIGIFLLRFMTLGNKIHTKYRSISVLITEQINLYLQIEQKPKKKDELMVSNSVLKLAADLLKELDTPFKISGLSANPYLFTTVKVVILSALSGVLSEMLGFKLKLHKIKIK